MRQRRELHENLVRAESPISEICSELNGYPWDSPEELVTLVSDDIRRVLTRLQAGEVSVNEVRQWADAVEMREDIGYEPDRHEEIVEAIYLLANPLLNGPIDQAMVAKILVFFPVEVPSARMAA
jgi:hypothetical protein